MMLRLRMAPSHGTSATSGNGTEDSGQHDEVGRLRSEVQRLRTLLREDSMTVSLISKCGYLHKYKSWAGVLEHPWVLRYFNLVGNNLAWFRTEKEQDCYPRGTINVSRCLLRPEGVKKGKMFVFCLEDHTAEPLLRLSTDIAGARDWMQVLQDAGCRLVSGAEKSAELSAEASEGSAHTPNGLPPLGNYNGANAQTQSDQITDSGTTGVAASADSVMRTDSGHEVNSRESSQRPRDKSKPFDPRSYRPSTAVHRGLKYSLLSSESLNYQRHAGLINLMMVIILAANSRLILENLLKYGILVRPDFWLHHGMVKDWPLLVCFVSMPLFMIVAWAVEHMAAFWRLPEAIVTVVNLMNIWASLLVPCYVIHRVESAPTTGFMLVATAITTWMKLTSYAHVNHDRRRALKDSIEADEILPIHPVDSAVLVNYPNNVTLKNLAYFMAAPTLCYQLSFPRTSKCRKRWLLRRVLELVVFTALGAFIIEQYVHPTIKNSRQHWQEMNFSRVAERVLKLSLPMLYVWLCFFYVFFHLWLNIIAEVLRFGDREFYKDWWNATTIEQYWRLWNMPVHKWLVRHVYFPSLRLGMSKSLALLAVFFVSAIFHELAVGLPCHMLRLWAFMGIMLQVPLVVLTNWLYRKFKKDAMGNVIFWLTFCILGQPICLLSYYHDWYQEYQAQEAAKGSMMDSALRHSVSPLNFTM